LTRENSRVETDRCLLQFTPFLLQQAKEKEFDQTHISLQIDDGTVKFRLFSEEAIKWAC
jgi:hypothetical protein